MRTAAEAAHIEIVPGVFSIGYSNDLLGADPNLAEGMPVKDALFVVKNGEARATTESPLLTNGDFSQGAKDWKLLDDCVHVEDGALVMRDAHGKNSRATRAVKLQPSHIYHLSVRVKSQDYGGKPDVKLLVGNRELNYAFLGAKQTQDWTVHHIVFNSLDHDTANLYLGVWGASGGVLSWDDVTLEEAGLVNLLRRPGCPFSIKTEDGKELVEGKDYEPVQDPKMGMAPYSGSYDVWHEPPAIKTKLPDGTRLRVSFYHTVIVYGEEVSICPSEPKTLELLRDEATRVNAAWQPHGFMMNHDEWRLMNWCEACQKRHLDAGAIAAQNARDCVNILQTTAPGCRMYDWSDMFDPNHNAHGNYYLVRGDYAGSWEGLSKDVIIMNWNHGKLQESLKFFADRGHRQIISGYYDAPVGKLRDHLAIAKDVPGVIGVMYTTWRKNYSDLEAFAKIADEVK